MQRNTPFAANVATPRTKPFDAVRLAPRLPLFKQEFPEIDLRLVSNIWAETTNLNGVDVEVRLGRVNWTDAQFEKGPIYLTSRPKSKGLAEARPHSTDQKLAFASSASGPW